MQKNTEQKIDNSPFGETVARIQQNDPATLKELYKVNFIKVKRFILKNSGNEQEAKDVYQEAFLAMWRNVKNDMFTAKSETAINGYIYKIAKNKWMDHLRSLRYKNTTFINREIEFDESEIDENETESKRIKLIMTAVNQLGERCQLLLKLFYFERRPFKEIAQIMNMEEASARNAKYRCQEQLKKMTQNTPNEPK